MCGGGGGGCGVHIITNEPFRHALPHDAQRMKRVLMQFANNVGPDQPSLSVYRINGYCSKCRRTENAQIRLRGCAC